MYEPQEVEAMSGDELRDNIHRHRERVFEIRLEQERLRSQMRTTTATSFDDMRTDSELVEMLRKMAWLRTDSERFRAMDPTDWPEDVNAGEFVHRWLAEKRVEALRRFDQEHGTPEDRREPAPGQVSQEALDVLEHGTGIRRPEADEEDDQEDRPRLRAL